MDLPTNWMECSSKFVFDKSPCFCGQRPKCTMLCDHSLMMWCAPMSKFSLHVSCTVFNYNLKFCVFSNCICSSFSQAHSFVHTIYDMMYNIKQTSPVYLNCAMKCNQISLTCLLQMASLMTVCFQAMLPDVVHYPSLDWPLACLPSHSARLPHSLFLLFFFLTFLFNYLMSPLLALTPIKMRAAQPALNCLCVSDHKSFCCGCKLSVCLAYHYMSTISVWWYDYWHDSTTLNLELEKLQFLLKCNGNAYCRKTCCENSWN